MKIAAVKNPILWNSKLTFPLPVHRNDKYTSFYVSCKSGKFLLVHALHLHPLAVQHRQPFLSSRLSFHLSSFLIVPARALDISNFCLMNCSLLSL
jgi:hypothetical protein